VTESYHDLGSGAKEGHPPDEDDAFEAPTRAEGRFGSFLDEDEVRAGSGKTSLFTAENVQLMFDRLELSGVLPELAKWYEEDQVEAEKHRGGVTAILDDRAILTAILLLRSEGSSLWISEMANIFWHRLTPKARILLGLGGVRDTGSWELDEVRWYNRASRRLHRIIDLMDAWPAARRNHTREERIAAMAKRQSTLKIQNTLRRKAERGRWFANAMIEMTFQAQPRDVRRQWKGGLSVDQTAMKAPSQSGRRMLDDKTRMEKIKLDTKGNEVDRLVMEIDADWYLADFSAIKVRTTDGPGGNWDWTYLATLTMQVADKPGVKPGHPLLIMAASVAKPNFEVGEEAVRAVKSILDRGHTISRLTADRGYAPNLKAEDYLVPLKMLNVPIVTDFKKTQKGLKSGKAGALFVEGLHVCPATPKALLEATQNFDLAADDPNAIDKVTYRKQIAERARYALRRKERLDADGHVPMMCPAYGPSATVDCPLREVHSRAANRSLVLILDENVPENPDKICTQSSVDFSPNDNLWEQPFLYGSDEWADTYKSDRNTVESTNDYLKDGPEKLRDPGERRVRGLAAQNFFLAMLVVSANLRKLARFLRDRERKTPKKVYPRRRDLLGLSPYVRKRKSSHKAKSKPEAPPLRT
jgi:hypothetical protein